jgi:hypothetical protein
LTSRSTFPPDDDEDTIELELTAEEMSHLSRPAPPQAAISKGRYPLWSVPLAAALVGVAVSIAWRPSPPHYVAPQLAPSPATASAPTTVSPPVVPAQLQAPRISQLPPLPQVPQVPAGRPVRVKNPFDPQEVFEFPAGTTGSEARQRVSELLLRRAVDRRSRAKGIETADRRGVKND